MTARQIRRAAERTALKQARKAAPTASAVQAAPEKDKPASSLTAVSTGATGRTVLLPSDEAAQYQLHIARFFSEYKPVGHRESELVQSLADTEWRLNRIPSLEAGIYALGRLEFADLFPNQDQAVRNHLIEAHIFLTYQRQLNNLSIQENRLRRQYQKDRQELLQLQKDRSEREDHAAEAETATTAPSVENGFEFSTVALDALEEHFGLDSEPADDADLLRAA
jgi:hypothetical protein